MTNVQIELIAPRGKYSQNSPDVYAIELSINGIQVALQGDFCEQTIREMFPNLSKGAFDRLVPEEMRGLIGTLNSTWPKPKTKGTLS